MTHAMNKKVTISIGLVLVLVMALLAAIGIMQLPASAAQILGTDTLYEAGEQEYHAVQFDPHDDWTEPYYLHVYNDQNTEVAVVPMSDREGDGIYVAFIPEKYSTYVIADSTNLSTATKKTETLTKLEKPLDDIIPAYNTYSTSKDSKTDNTTYTVSTERYSVVWNDANGNFKIDNGEKTYLDLAEATRAAPSGSYLVLAGSQVNVYTIDGISLRIDLNGYTIESKAKANMELILVNNGATLHISDATLTGRIDAGANDAIFTIKAANGSIVSLSGGHYSAPGIGSLFWSDETSHIYIESESISTNVRPEIDTYVNHLTSAEYCQFIEDDYGYWVPKLFAPSEAAAMFDENGNYQLDSDEICYYVLNDAVEAASLAGGGRVILMDDVTLVDGLVFYIGEYSLDLGGYSITASSSMSAYTNMIYVASGSKLTIEASLSGSNTIDASVNKGFIISNYGELVIDNMYIKLLAHANTIPISTQDITKLHLEHCQTNFDPYYLLPPNYQAQKNEDGLWQISSVASVVAFTDRNENGIYDSDDYRFGDLSHALAYGGTVILIEDVTYSNTTAGKLYNPLINLQDTRLDLNGYTVTVAEGSVLTMMGMEAVIYDSRGTGVLDASRSTYTVKKDEELYIEGGTIYRGTELFDSTSGIYISAGYFDFDPTAFVDTKTYTVEKEGALWKVLATYAAWEDTDKDGIHDENETTYATLQAAISSGSYISLARDIDDDDVYQAITIISRVITVNFNGFTISSKRATRIFDITDARVTFTTTKGGGISGTCPMWINGNADVIIENGTFSDQLSLEAGNGNLTIKNGTFAGGIHISVASTGTLIIEGGSFQYFSSVSKYLASGLTTVQEGSVCTVYQDGAVECTVTVTGEYIYNGNAQIPTVLVQDSKGNTLIEQLDYTLSYANNTAAGTATVTVTYVTASMRGSESTNFTIAKKPLTLQPADTTITEGEGFTGTTSTANGLLSGHTVSVTYEAIAATQGGSYNIAIATVTILDAEENDVTANYAIDKKTGTLTVTHTSVAENGIYTCCDSYVTPALSEDNYYELENAGHLFWFAAHVNAGNKTANARLLNHIDLESRVWTTITPTGLYYSAYGTDLGYAGIFDGNGYTIRNLALASSKTEEASVGLFGTVSGTIKNLGIIGVTFTHGGKDIRAGAIVGQLITTTGLVTDCYVINAVITPGAHVTGGIAGCVYEGTIQNCYIISSSITGTQDRYGFIAGDTRADGSSTDRPGTLINCYTDSTILYSTRVGNISNCATVTQEQITSGILAYWLGLARWGQELGVDESPVPGGMKLYPSFPCPYSLSNTEAGTKEHTYPYTCSTICSTCDQIGRTETVHTYTDLCDATCNNCGEPRTDIHRWDNACDSHCDLCGYDRIITHEFDNGICKICNKAVSYIVYTWDAENHTLISATKTPTSYTLVTNSLTALTSGWYVVNGQVTLNTRLTVSGEVHLILLDGSSLTVNGGIQLTSGGNSLTIYGEEFSSGILQAIPTSTSDHQAGIGGDSRNQSCGIFTMHGGNVTATGKKYAAGVGGASSAGGGTVTVYGGTLTATSGENYGAGIGASYQGSAGTVRIYGGTVYATGRDSGIGTASRYSGTDSLIEIHGGTVVAKSTYNGAGIGAGNYSHAGTILITGGHVTATGGYSSAGIGGGDGYTGADGYHITITGGTVIAKGGDFGGAGIGGGEYSGSTGKIFISGGTITATGGYATNNNPTSPLNGAPGIGGGSHGHGGLIVITGGTITATAGRPNVEAIGTGYGGTGYAYFTATTGIIKQAYTFDEDFTIESGVTLTIEAGATMTVAQGVTIYNNGTVILNGTVVNNGTIICADTSHCQYACDLACRFCGKANANAAAHSYKSDCGTECTVCGYVRPATGVEHSYENGYCSLCGAPMPAELDETENVYLIGNLAQLEWFFALVNSGTTDANAKLTASIRASENLMIGTSENQYSGTFDGNGYTITVNLVNNTTTNINLALFCYVNGATIKNLTVDGSVTTNGKYAAGIVGRAVGATTLENCISRVEIVSNVNGDGTHGGLVSLNNAADAVLRIKNCAFLGSITGSQTTSCGGFVGWTDGTVIIENSYLAGSFTTDTSSCYTFARASNLNNVTITNCYYLTAYGTTNSGAVAKTAAEFATGDVAYLLGTPWGQTIGTNDAEEYPVLGGATVYRAENTNCQNEGNGTYVYSNSASVSGMTGLHDFDTYGACRLCDVAYAIPEVMAGITVGGTFGIDYYIKPDENATACGVIYNGKDYPATDGMASITGIAAKALCDSITVTPYQIIDGVRYTDDDITCSVADLLTYYVYDDAYTDTAVQDIAIASLNYGAAAQVYFGYKTNTLANAGLTEEMKTVTHGDTYTQAGGIKMDGTPTAAMLGMSLLLNDRINFKLIVATEVANAQVEIANNESFTDSTKIALAATEDGANFKAIMEGIAPASWNTSFYFRVVDANGNAISHTLVYSVTAYCQGMAGDEAVAPVIDAILALYDAVADFQAS